MAKKKSTEVAYVPLNTSTDIPQITEQKVAQIPAYEDSGVKFQGKYKTQQGLSTYELKGQQTRWYHLVASAIGVTTFTRQNKDTTKFFCTKIIVSSYGKAGFGTIWYDTLADVVSGQASVKFVFHPTAAAQSVVFDLSDSPRLFEGDFAIDKYMAGGAEFTAITLFGWEEQR